MQEVQLSSADIAAFERAIARNPQTVVQAVGQFLVRGMAAFNRLLIRNPWRVGLQGGGVPVRTGNLRDTHLRSIGRWEARVGPDLARAPYAPYVHGIAGHPRKRTYPLRPWLDYVVQQSERDINTLQKDLVGAVVNDLAA